MALNIDHDLIAACSKNDRKAQNTLYKELFSYLMNICMRYKKDYDLAGAAVNGIFLQILTNIEKYDMKKPILPWVKTIAVRKLIDEFRKEKKIMEVELNTDIEVPVQYVDINDALSQLGVNDILNMIKELPEASAEVFNLYCIDGYTHVEIAEMLGISAGTSKWHLHKARTLLKEKLEKESVQSESLTSK